MDVEQYALERIQEMKSSVCKLKDELKEKRLYSMREIFVDGKEGKTVLKKILTELMKEKTEGALVISYLRSSYITGSHNFYIAYYLEDIFVEEEPVSAWYSMKSAFRGVENDWKELYKALEKNYFHILEAEKEEIRRWYMGFLYADIEKILQLILAVDGQESGMDVYYGGYMDSVKKIGRI